MGTYKLVPQIRRSGNHHGTETIVITKFRGLHCSGVSIVDFEQVSAT